LIFTIAGPAIVTGFPISGAFCSLAPVLKSIRVAVRTLVFRHFRYHPAGPPQQRPDLASVLRKIRDLHEMIARDRDFNNWIVAGDDLAFEDWRRQPLLQSAS